VINEELLQRSIEHLHGPEEVAYEPDELVVVCLVRDGRPYVKSFVEHYLSLGVKHIAFLDNNSTDGTVEALKNYENVTVLRTKLPYKAGPGGTECLFKQYIITRFGNKNGWCLCVDIDELFDYPYSDVVGLGSLLRYLNDKRYTAVVAQMLDMFSREPLSGRAGHLDETLKEAHRFYDISDVTRKSIKELPHLRGNTYGSDEIEEFRGGIRSTIFDAKPLLTKHPLVLLDGSVKPIDDSSHWVGNARVADLTCVLFHYKFLDGHLRKQAAQAVREEQYYENSAVYKRYLEVLDRNPSLHMKRATAREIKSVNDLVENQFLIASEDYVSWATVEKERSTSKVKTEPAVSEVANPETRWAAPEHADLPVPEASEAAEPHQGQGTESKEGVVSNPGQATDIRGKARTKWTSKSEPPEKARPLFVCGCARSGTTAFADYLNRHHEVLLCQERYKNGMGRERIAPDLFTFERILDFRPKEMEKPIWKNGREFFVKYHTELLARKDPAELRWFGDKGPFYVRCMDVLAKNNPGAHFIVLYRPIEEVVESWEARATDPDDHWASHRGTEEAVKIWNIALQKTREFIESSPIPRVLIVSYRDFFYRNEAVVPLVSRFLGLEFDESMIRAWREASLEFESGRRRKEPLSEEQQSFIQENAERAAEAWVIERIENQWSELGLDVEK
jgi:hypothetical protein